MQKSWSPDPAWPAASSSSRHWQSVDVDFDTTSEASAATNGGWAWESEVSGYNSGWATETPQSSSHSSPKSSPDRFALGSLGAYGGFVDVKRPDISSSSYSHHTPKVSDKGKEKDKKKQRYIGPVFSSASDAEDGGLQSGKDDEAEFNAFKMSVRIQKIQEFHSEAAEADVRLAMQVEKVHKVISKEYRGDRKADIAELISRHEHKMLMLQRTKEEERKSIVDAERQKRKQEIRGRASRSATISLPTVNVAPSVAALTAALAAGIGAKPSPRPSPFGEDDDDDEGGSELALLAAQVMKGLAIDKSTRTNVAVATGKKTVNVEAAPAPAVTLRGRKVDPDPQGTIRGRKFPDPSPAAAAAAASPQPPVAARERKASMRAEAARKAEPSPAAASRETTHNPAETTPVAKSSWNPFEMDIQSLLAETAPTFPSLWGGGGAAAKSTSAAIRSQTSLSGYTSASSSASSSAAATPAPVTPSASKDSRIGIGSHEFWIPGSYSQPSSSNAAPAVSKSSSASSDPKSKQSLSSQETPSETLTKSRLATKRSQAPLKPEPTTAAVSTRGKEKEKESPPPISSQSSSSSAHQLKAKASSADSKALPTSTSDLAFPKQPDVAPPKQPVRFMQTETQGASSSKTTLDQMRPAPPPAPAPHSFWIPPAVTSTSSSSVKAPIPQPRAAPAPDGHEIWMPTPPTRTRAISSASRRQASEPTPAAYLVAAAAIAPHPISTSPQIEKAKSMPQGRAELAVDVQTKRVRRMSDPVSPSPRGFSFSDANATPVPAGILKKGKVTNSGSSQRGSSSSKAEKAKEKEKKPKRVTIEDVADEEEDVRALAPLPPDSRYIIMEPKPMVPQAMFEQILEYTDEDPEFAAPYPAHSDSGSRDAAAYVPKWDAPMGDELYGKSKHVRWTPSVHGGSPVSTLSNDKEAELTPWQRMNGGLRGAAASKPTKVEKKGKGREVDSREDLSRYALDPLEGLKQTGKKPASSAV